MTPKPGPMGSWTAVVNCPALLDENRVVVARVDVEAQVTIAISGIVLRRAKREGGAPSRFFRGYRRVAAEELVVGEPSTGSEADLKRATNTARDMAGRFGMSPRLGRVRVLHDHGEVFWAGTTWPARTSQPTLEHLDAEVRRILDEQEATA